MTTSTSIAMSRRKVLLLTGATATGKSSIVSKLHHLSKIEIIVADSVQIRKNVNLGATKPSVEEMNKIPHHLLNLVDTTTFFSAGDYIDAIKPVLCDIVRHKQDVIPTIVGGNTMWVDWLINGVPDAPGGTTLGKQEARRILKDFSNTGNWDDAVSLVSNLSLPEAFTPPSRNDWHRLHRFLEVILARKDLLREKSDSGAKRQISIFQSEELKECDVRCFFISDDRLRLYRNIDLRCEAMVEMGLVEEVCKLLLDRLIFALPPNTSGFTFVSPVCSAAIGYRQTVDYLLQDNYQFEDVEQFLVYLRSFTTATRNYARHQLHWYRNQKSFLWLHPKGLPTSKSKESLDGVTEELYHWMNVPREIYDSVLFEQFEEAKRFEQEISKMNSKVPRNYSNSKTKWSAQEPMMRACEGNINPELLRRYSEKFQLLQNPEKLKNILHRIDKCRLLLEKDANKVNDLKNTFVIKDKEHENI